MIFVTAEAIRLGIVEDTKVAKNDTWVGLASIALHDPDNTKPTMPSNPNPHNPQPAPNKCGLADE